MSRRSRAERDSVTADACPPARFEYVAGFRLGQRKQDLPPEAARKSPAALFRFVMRFFEAYPTVVDEIASRVDFESGRPRQLTVRVVLAGAITSGIGGDMHWTKATGTLVSLPLGVRNANGITWTNAKTGIPESITYARVQTLLTNIARAYAAGAVAHNHLVHDEATGDVVDTETGLLFGSYDEYSSEQQASFECASSCPVTVTLEGLFNKLLADLWAYLKLPEPGVYALDSYPIQTHFAAKAHGGTANIDPRNMPEDVRDLADTRPDVSPRKQSKANVSGKPQKSWRSKPTRSAQRRELASLRAEWESQPINPRNPRSRSIPATGPTAPGKDFMRIDATFPRIGSDLRLQHTLDSGAGNTFRGAGSSRRSEIVNGRDKHALVASGLLPDGSAFPPLLRAFAARKGGENKPAAGLDCLDYAIGTGASLHTVSLDRGYTGVPADEMLLPSLRRGVALVRDLNGYHHEDSPWSDGVQLIDGFFFTNGTPDALRDIPALDYRAPKAQRAAAREKYDERKAFAFRAMGPANDGKQRYRGPAQGSVKYNAAGTPVGITGYTAKCVNSPHFGLMADRTKPITKCKKGDVCGCSKTITVHAHNLPSSFEPLIFGTSEWNVAKGRRSLVESYNATDEYHYNVNRHSIQVHAERWDLAHGLLVIALLIVAVYHWIMRLGAWAIDSAELEDCDFAQLVAACLTRVTMVPDPPERE